jgi:hypothetical protein
MLHPFAINGLMPKRMLGCIGISRKLPVWNSTHAVYFGGRLRTYVLARRLFSK